MQSLIFTIILSSYLFIAFRIFDKFKVDTTLAIVVNYFVCAITGLIFEKDIAKNFNNDILSDWFANAVIIGILFLVTFSVMAFITQRISITVSSVAAKMSFVIPCLVSFLVFKTITNLSVLMIVGILTALLAVVLTTYKKEDKEIKEKRNPLIHLLPVFLFLMSGFLDSFINYNNLYLLSSENQPRFILYIFSTAFIGGVFVVIYRSVILKIQLNIKSILAGILLGVPNYFSMYYLVRALSDFNNNGAFVYSTYNISIILINTIAGVLFFKEALSKINYMGVVASVVALILLSV